MSFLCLFIFLSLLIFFVSNHKPSWNFLSLIPFLWFRLQIPHSVFLCCHGKMMAFSYLNNISIDLYVESPLPLSKGTWCLRTLDHLYYLCCHKGICILNGIDSSPLFIKSSLLWPGNPVLLFLSYHFHYYYYLLTYFKINLLDPSFPNFTSISVIPFPDSWFHVLLLPVV